MSNNEKVFNEKGYCVVKGVVSEELRDFITQYALFDEMQDFTPDTDQVIGAHAKYGNPAMEAMLLNLHSIMEEHTGLTLFPTYSFYRVYRTGDTLEPHVDRESCEISCTVCFNYSYENYQWPIFMNGVSITLEPGDIAIYKGCEVEHWRETFSAPGDNPWHVQGFFHFVNSNGPYAEWKFDKRASIGALRNPAPISNPLVSKSYIQFTK